MLAIPSMGRGPLATCIAEACHHAKDPLDVLLWSNGAPLIFDGSDLYNSGRDAHGQVFVGGSTSNIGVTPALHKLYEMGVGVGLEDPDWLLFLHDDTILMHHGWDLQLERWISERPNMGLFGFGGARGLGDPDLYTKPYELPQLARRDFISNMKNAELHGRRVEEPTRVSTLDLFSIGANVGFLRQIGGWSFWPHVHHSMDNAICCEAARLGREVWMLPIKCDHLGGQTSTKTDFMADFGQPEGKIHSDGHVTLYERYRDILPLLPEQL